MGTSNSKTAVTPEKPEPSRRVRNERVCRLVDPRSPSTGIDRTPIQVGVAPQIPIEVESECPATTDPRSPSLGISRTPMKDVVTATVGSFAHRLGVLLLKDGVDVVRPVLPIFPKIEDLTGVEEGEMDSTEPLLPIHPSLDPVPSPNADLNVQMEQVEVEIGVEASQFLDVEGDVVDNGLTPDVILSSSLITSYNGVVSSQALPSDIGPSCAPLDADTHKELVPDGARSPLPVSSEPSIHSAAVVSGAAVPSSGSAEYQSQPDVDVSCNPLPVGQGSAFQNQPGSGENRIKIPTFNTQSPSQLVFKPQWLGVGFGMTGVRVREVQGRGRRASPLSLCNRQSAGNENKGQISKPKQRERCGKALGSESRSPLQILKETNSPRDHGSKMKARMTTPDRVRRILSVDKENQR